MSHGPHAGLDASFPALMAYVESTEPLEPTAAPPVMGTDATDEDILKDARDFLTSRIAAESDTRKAALNDLQFITGDQWPAEVKAARQADNRPCSTINKLPTFLKQVTNDQRQNRTSIKVHAVDDDADQDVADVISGLVRHIEYDSDADVAYDSAVNSATQIGFGYFRLVTEYTSDDSFDQDIKFKRVRNAFTVYLGPHIQPDGSDMTKAMVTEEIDKAEFEKAWPGKDCDISLQRGIGDNVKEWLTKDKVRLAEFYRVETSPAKVVRLTDGTSAFEDEIPEGKQVDAGPDAKSRSSQRRKVCWYKVTGVQVLERAEIPCYWIPVFPVYGDEYDVDGKIIRSGLIRNAKDPAQMYNVWMTAATEEIGLRPKVPYIGAVGQFETDSKWANANVRSYPYMEYDPVTVDGTMAPAPQRQPMSDVPTGVLAMALHASDDIKATTGIFNASLGAQGNETSGRAILARQKEGDVGSFNYADGLTRTQRHAARCILWMLPRVYDTERMVRIVGEDEEVQHVTINRPKQPQEMQQEQQAQQQMPPDKRKKAIATVENDLTVGKYDVTLSSGPSYTTQRQEEADALTQLAQSWPKLMDVAGDLVVRSYDWHGADAIADRIKNTIPPQVLGPKEGEDPAALQGQINQLTQELQQATLERQHLSQALENAAQQHQELEQKMHNKDGDVAAKMQGNDIAAYEAETGRIAVLNPPANPSMSPEETHALDTQLLGSALQGLPIGHQAPMPVPTQALTPPTQAPPVMPAPLNQGAPVAPFSRPQG